MHIELTLHPRRIGLILAAITCILVILSITGEYINTEVIDADAHPTLSIGLDLFSVNAEETIPTWDSVLNLLLATGLLAFIAQAKYQSRDRYAFQWLVLALIFLYLALDEGAAIHEILSDPLQQAFQTSGYLAFGWQVLAVPLVIIFALLYLPFLFRLPPTIRNLFILAGVMYAGGALIGDAIGASLWQDDGEITLIYLITGTVEEFCEMIGVVIFIYALLTYVVEHHYYLTLRPQPPAVVLPTPADASAEAEGLTLLRPGLTQEFIPARSIQPTRSWIRFSPAALVIGFLMLTNAALLFRIVNLPSETGRTSVVGAGSDDHTRFYQSLNDRLKSDAVTVVRLESAFSPDAPATYQIAHLLLSLSDQVMVVSFPTAHESFIFAGTALPFDRDSLANLLQSSGESEYIIFDTGLVKLLTQDQP